DTQLGRGEPISDTAIVMSSMLDAIMIRTYAHGTLTGFAAHSRVPVINGLSDELHPFPLRAAIVINLERRGTYAVKWAHGICHRNNSSSSYIEAAIQFDFQLRVACPEGYEPSADLLAQAGDRVTLLRDPREAVAGAHLVSTDVWASMGQEDEAQARMQSFKGY